VSLPAVRWPSPETDMQDTILATPLRSDGLLLPVPEGPGLGVELDPAKVERYTVPGSVVSV
jgi:L-alanine-DL-glutamate epimerase-like enolase superfamily enzyme